MQIKLSIAERFEDARLEHNQHGKQTTQEVSKETGVSVASINALENNDRGVSYRSVIKLAEHYGVSADYLLGFSDAWSTEPDLQAAVDYLGYSQKTIENLKNLNGNISPEEQQVLKLAIADNGKMEVVDQNENIKNALDEFFSSKGIHDFFSLILRLKETYEDVLDDLLVARCPEEYLHDMIKENLRVQHAAFDVGLAVMRIAEQAFIEKGDN